MCEHGLELSNVETDEDLKRALVAFRERNGIVVREPKYEDFHWCDENLKKYREELQRQERKSEGRKLFYLASIGSVQKNDRLIAAVVRVKCGHPLREEEIFQILEDSPPLLRVEVMEETEAGSGWFQERTFDLVLAAMERGAKDLLERLMPHIDFNRYSREDVFDILK